MMPGLITSKTILPLLLAVGVFFAAFMLILPKYYLKLGAPDQTPIDMQAWHTQRPSTAQYVMRAARESYNDQGIS